VPGHRGEGNEAKPRVIQAETASYGDRRRSLRKVEDNDEHEGTATEYSTDVCRAGHARAMGTYVGSGAQHNEPVTRR
jgi:hypothetical protein